MKRRSFLSTARRFLAGAGMLLLVVQPGCGGGGGGDLPATYQATGTIAWDDGQPMNGGLVEFQRTDGPPVTTNGRIQPDGTFSLITLVAGEKLDGASPGAYKVVIIPDMGDQTQETLPEPFALPEPQKVIADGPNEFEIIVKRGPRR